MFLQNTMHVIYQHIYDEYTYIYINIFLFSHYSILVIVLLQLKETVHIDCQLQVLTSTD